MQKQKIKQRTLPLGSTVTALIASVFLLLILSAGYGVVFTLMQTHQEKSIEELREAENMLQEFYTLNSKRRLITQTADRRDTLAQYFVSERSVGNFFAEIESRADRANVAMNIIDAGAGVSGDQRRSDTLRINLEVQGKFNDVYYFIELLRFAPYALNISQLELAQKNQVAFDTGVPVQEELWSATLQFELLSYIPLAS